MYFVAKVKRHTHFIKFHMQVTKFKCMCTKTHMLKKIRGVGAMVWRGDAFFGWQMRRRGEKRRSVRVLC
jgi:hypothetical protein